MQVLPTVDHVAECLLACAEQVRYCHRLPAVCDFQADGAGSVRAVESPQKLRRPTYHAGPTDCHVVGSLLACAKPGRY